ncbi:hypothetical protein Ae201684P_022444 [Aphanomyces euteiches]|uniref:protein-serine/threonine phosphatase n=1 Tax=Aphanomyces euteiches TaxID=100861 RepID=A0A6G0X689_9STRA|nr:hypothetical protein Ae201684_008112 [Aphanomyces euteiches]KAH9074642.1 hypothetical protein Ae201684P_022444 [Aphanomyces euteiches]KAH9146018.1 hypothetical protein AeRB84_010076 [Aphanomyces euteiches]
MSLATVVLVAKWKKEELELHVPHDTSVLQVKEMLYTRTRVLPHRQKLVGINRDGKPAPDHTLLQDLTLKNPHKFMLIGTVEDDIFVDPQSLPKAALPRVFDDFACKFSPGSTEWTHARENHDRLDKMLAATEISLINPFRCGKKLLVLDLDHTLMDITATKDASISIDRFRRPFMHEFLTTVWQKFDIGIWSQTSWKWIEIKLTELGMLTTPDYRINFILDKTSMFSTAGGKNTKVKALRIIWQSFPETWHARNTLHVDDLPHNFALNPRNGIPIARYDCKQPEAYLDRELLHLAKYLVDVCADLTDVTDVDHTTWTQHRR